MNAEGGVRRVVTRRRTAVLQIRVTPGEKSEIVAAKGAIGARTFREMLLSPRRVRRPSPLVDAVSLAKLDAAIAALGAAPRDLRKLLGSLERGIAAIERRGVPESHESASSLRELAAEVSEALRALEVASAPARDAIVAAVRGALI